MELLFDRLSLPGRLALEGPPGAKVAVLGHQIDDQLGTGRSDQFVFEIIDANVKAVLGSPCHPSGRVVSRRPDVWFDGQSRFDQGTPHHRPLTGIAQPAQGQPGALGPEVPEMSGQSASTADRDHDLALGPEIATDALGRQLNRHLVADPFDQDGPGCVLQPAQGLGRGPGRGVGSARVGRVAWHRSLRGRQPSRARLAVVGDFSSAIGDRPFRARLGAMDLPQPSPEAVAALAPTGTLRAAINLSNFLLVTGKGDHDEPLGVSPDLAAALAEQMGVGIELLRYKSPGAVADDGNTGAWDIANIGAEPKRAVHINFTSAYCQIEATYLVRADSPLTALEEVDRAGHRIVAPARAAYGLWLERNVKEAELVLVEELGGVTDVWSALSDPARPGMEGSPDLVEATALAGLRPGLLADQTRFAGSRILDGHFSTVQQAIGTPKDRDPAGFEYLRRFVEAAKASGLVARLITSHQVDGLSVAPPGQ